MKSHGRWIRRGVGASSLGLLLLSGCLVVDIKMDSKKGSRSPSDEKRSEDSARKRLSPDRYAAHVAFLSHDELEGRGTGEDGIDLAAGYIAAHFSAAGLEPCDAAEGFFQEFTIPRGGELLDSTALRIEGAEATPLLKSDYSPFGFSAAGEFAGDVVFVGYGITNEDKDYDDYKDMDVIGKAVLMLRREPPGWNEEGGFTRHARFSTKVALAAKHGATAVLIANQDPGEDGVDGLMPFRGIGQTEDIAALHVTRALAGTMLQAGGAPSLTELQSAIDDDGAFASQMLAGVNVSGQVEYKHNEIKARNVVAVLPGTGRHADEYIVIGGHYDHLGHNRGRIFNGADDNASGSAGVMELAYALADTPNRDRSVIFMTFTGEEIGLLGSQHFAANPTVPIESIVAMINMDMIGRLNHDEEENMLAIQGLGTGSTFDEIVARHTAARGIKFIPDPSALGPSDHASFYRAGVPSLFFFTGVHADYHRPGDDFEKINVPGAVEVVNLVYGIALDLINAAPSPQYVEVNERAKIFRGAAPRGGGVVMGIMPDMEDDSAKPGWRIARVMPDGGAAKAGMKDGDRIVSIESKPVNDMGDYRDATSGKKPGDVLAVKVLRGDTEIDLKVELAGRGAR